MSERRGTFKAWEESGSHWGLSQMQVPRPHPQSQRLRLARGGHWGLRRSWHPSVQSCWTVDQPREPDEEESVEASGPECQTFIHSSV